MRTIRWRGFTLMELIIVITILAILSTIAFIAYSNYTSSARDSSRLSDLSQLSKSITVQYVKSSNHILPDGSITLVNSSATVWFQWTAGKNLLSVLRATSNGFVDPTDKTYYTYSLNKNKTRYELLAFLDAKPANIADVFVNNAYATDYTDRYPYVRGDLVWVVYSQSGTKYTPLQDSVTAGTTSFDIVSGTNAGSMTIKATNDSGDANLSSTGLTAAAFTYIDTKATATWSSGSTSGVSWASGVTSLWANSYGFYYVKADGTSWVLGWWPITPFSYTNVAKIVDGQAGNTLLCKLGTATDLQCWEPGNTMTVNTTGYTDVAVSGFATICAVNTSWALKCYWANNNWQLGIGTTDYTNRPFSAFASSAISPTGLTSGVTNITMANFGANCVIQNGAVNCWGYVSGGGAFMSSTPSVITGLESWVTAVESGDYNACAIQSGALKCWGNNTYGSLGNGTVSASSSKILYTPTGMTSWVTSVAVSGDANYGWAHTCAVKDGGVWCWGSNNKGQLWDGTNTDKSVPTQVIGLSSGVSKVFAGGKGGSGQQRTCAVLTNWTVKCWWDNYGGMVSATSNVPLSATIP